VRDALVAIDAGLLGREQEALMCDRRARRLPRDIHRLGRAAISAFERIVRLQPRPLVQRQLKPVLLEFLAGID
jgi:hypothetical protein